MLNKHRVLFTDTVNGWCDDEEKTDFLAIAVNDHLTDYTTGVSEEDAMANADAWIRREVNGDPGRIMTVHQYDQTTKVWIITDWWHPNHETVTTVLFPQDY
jgi:hypothetical protein